MEQREVQIRKSPRIRLVFEGKEYMLKKPGVGRAIDFESEAASLKEDVESKRMTPREGGLKMKDLMTSFFEECGLPKDVALAMDDEEIEQVRECLAPKKKG